MIRFFILCLLAVCSIHPDEFRLATLPKAGTHLLVKSLYLLGALPEVSESQFGGITLNRELQNKYGWHIYRNPPTEEFLSASPKKIIMVRDIRAVMLSLHYWMPYLYIKLSDPERYEQCINSFGGDMEAQLLHLIQGDPNAFGSDHLIRFHIAEELYKKRSEYPNLLFVKYEDLIGPNGGGSLQKQIETIQTIANFLSLEAVSDVDAEKIAEQLWGGTETFNTSPTKGQIDSWRTQFNEEHIQAVKEDWNSYLLTFGYELTEDWKQ